MQGLQHQPYIFLVLFQGLGPGNDAVHIDMTDAANEVCKGHIDPVLMYRGQVTEPHRHDIPAVLSKGCSESKDVAAAWMITSLEE